MKIKKIFSITNESGNDFMNNQYDHRFKPMSSY
jgi:hypothetical protein